MQGPLYYDQSVSPMAAESTLEMAGAGKQW